MTSNLKYKLKLTVGNNEYYADVNWNNALDGVFNKRHRRIPDKGGQPYFSASTCLSEFITKSVIISDNTLPMIPKDSNMLWRGYRETNYSNFSGTVGKVGIGCETLFRNPNKTFYTMTFRDMVEDASNSSPKSLTIEGQYCNPFGIDNRDEKLIYHTSAYYENDYSFYKLRLPKQKWGLDGVNGIDYRSRMDSGVDYDSSSRCRVSSECRHDYTYNRDAMLEYFEPDHQPQTQTVGGVDITYDTCNCMFFFRNDFYGTTAGDSYTQNDDYILVNESVMYKILRVGQYNNPSFPYADYPFKPTGCDAYYNMTTKKYEFENAAEDFQMFLNVELIEKENMRSVLEGMVELTNTFSIDTSKITHQGIDTALDEVLCLSEVDFTFSYLTSNKIPIRLFLGAIDGDKVYICGGITSTTQTIYSYRLSDIINGVQQITLNFETDSNISDFLHTLFRKNLHYKSCIPGIADSELGYIVNQNTGVVDDIGYFKWVIAGNADFGNVSIESGQTFKFELIEDIT